eukprot:3662804-Rhodomonas_salina.9
MSALSRVSLALGSSSCPATLHVNRLPRHDQLPITSGTSDIPQEHTQENTRFDKSQHLDSQGCVGIVDGLGRLLEPQPRAPPLCQRPALRVPPEPTRAHPISALN